MADTTSIEEKRVAHIVEEARAKLGSADGELVLDFSSVRRIDARGIRDMEQLALAADEQGIKPALRGVNIELYKVLKLVKLAPRFSFVT
ncbi:MAG: STAS domain-containing protein [Terriglobales bacterium]